MGEFLNKLKSRKFLTCIAGVVMGVCMVFGLDEGTVNTISGAIVAVGSVVTYIYTEGKIDAAAVDKIKDTVDKVEDAIGEVKEIEE
jgi:phage shock protein PspC (stress-responsive transcriptional regulator)